jgi:hypothetical protein
VLYYLANDMTFRNIYNDNVAEILYIGPQAKLNGDNIMCADAANQVSQVVRKKRIGRCELQQKTTLYTGL